MKMSLIIARLLDKALALYQNFSSDTSEFKAIKHLATNKNIVIQKADKGNTVVILDKCD